jgi:mRNA-degrading endonuclease RelE of RelBE toxin-antitoxin system
VIQKICLQYDLEIGEKAREQLRALPKDLRRNIGQRMQALCTDLQGDVAKLKAHDNRYRLRVGSYRVLFVLARSRIQVYAVKNRKEAYD